MQVSQGALYPTPNFFFFWETAIMETICAVIPHTDFFFLHSQFMKFSSQIPLKFAIFSMMLHIFSSDLTTFTFLFGRDGRLIFVLADPNLGQCWFPLPTESVCRFMYSVEVSPTSRQGRLEHHSQTTMGLVKHAENCPFHQNNLTCNEVERKENSNLMGYVLLVGSKRQKLPIGCSST